MPAPTDHDARRRDVTEAVWRVLARTGFAGLSLRAVASEMGATTGLLTHYFPGKRALVEHALQVVHERTDVLLRDEPTEPGLAGLRSRLQSVLPTSAEGVVLSRIWVSFWDLALADEEWSRAEAARYDRWRGKLRPHVVAALERGELARADPEALLDTLTSVTHGLVVQALFDPTRYPAERQRAVLDALLASLRGAA
jgi:AcrR family transcriptional regulator